MKIFIADSGNRTQTYSLAKSLPAPGTDEARFGNEEQLASSTQSWPLTRLACLWNNLSGARPIRKFTDRSTALRRIWAKLQTLTPEKPTKSEIIVGLLVRPSGASVREIMTATGWQAHSVRAFISAQISKKLGARVVSAKREGVRVYRIR